MATTEKPRVDIGTFEDTAIMVNETEPGFKEFDIRFESLEAALGALYAAHASGGKEAEEEAWADLLFEVISHGDVMDYDVANAMAVVAQKNYQRVMTARNLHLAPKAESEVA